MVIGVDAIFPKLAAHDLCGTIGDDFVDVHVVTGARTRLDGIDHELVVPLPIDDFLRGLDDGVGALMIQ